VADREADPRRVAIGPDLPHGRLVDVAVRGALLTDAQVRVVEPGTVTEDIAALCRFRTTS
jgi:hypothetical protein